MKSQYSLNDRIKKQIYKKIDIFNYSYFSANKKEAQVFQNSVKFSKKRYYKEILREMYESSLEYKFYYFQLLIELLNRYHDKMGINEENFNYLILAYEDLKICYRLLYLGYYTTAGFHLRGFFEKSIYGIYYNFVKIKKLSPLKNENNVEQVIKECLKVGELTCKNKNLKKDVYNEYYFPTGEILKLYKNYSSNYVHGGKPNTELKFSEDEFKNLYFLIHITLIYIPRFFKATIGNEIEKYRKNKILNPVEGYLYYWNYLQYLFGENKLFTNQYSEIYNLIFDNEHNIKFVSDIGIDTNNLLEKEYLEQIRISNSFRKKAKGNRKKYNNLIREYYENIDNKKGN